MRRRQVQALRSLRRDMVNPLRVATNLATNALTWWALAQHPQLGPLAARYAAEHRAGLARVAEEMAERTAQALEATRFLDALRGLLATGRCVLIPRGQESAAAPEPLRVIGWQAEDGGAYLLLALARAAVEGVLGADGLNGISSQALYSQLASLGLLASHDADRRTQEAAHRRVHRQRPAPGRRRAAAGGGGDRGGDSMNDVTGHASTPVHVDSFSRLRKDLVFPRSRFFAARAYPWKEGRARVSCASPKKRVRPLRAGDAPCRRKSGNAGTAERTRETEQCTGSFLYKGHSQDDQRLLRVASHVAGETSSRSTTCWRAAAASPQSRPTRPGPIPGPISAQTTRAGWRCWSWPTAAMQPTRMGSSVRCSGSAAAAPGSLQAAEQTRPGA